MNRESGSGPGKDTDDVVGLAHLLEMDNAVDLREECVIAADADIRARAEPGSTLADKDASGRNCLTAEALYAETLRIAVAAVS
jgi:hypothetical protein